METAAAGEIMSDIIVLQAVDSVTSKKCFCCKDLWDGMRLTVEVNTVRFQRLFVVNFKIYILPSL